MNKTQNTKKVMIRVLSLVGYSEDKGEFANEFIETCKEQALLDLANSLPEDKKESLKSELSKENTQEKNTEVLTSYFSEKEYNKALEEATRDAFQNYVQSILATLSDSQRTNLQAFLESLKQT